MSVPDQPGLFDPPGVPSPLRSDAHFSGDGVHRYWLHRAWDDGGDGATFVMLNPSTADAVVNDRTINRCIGFAKEWGCTHLRVVNLYALRSTDPDALWVHDDPVGPDNDMWIEHALKVTAGPVVAAWGVNARLDRVMQVLALPRAQERLMCLGVTKNGAPKHPLFVPGGTPLVPYRP